MADVPHGLLGTEEGWPVEPISIYQRVPDHYKPGSFTLKPDPWEYTVTRLINEIARRWRKYLVGQPVNARKQVKVANWFDAMSWVNAYKAFYGCQHCGERDASCLDFHHRDASDKEMSVSAIVVSGKGRAYAELEARKCDVVCANCHRKSHHRERYGLPSLTLLATRCSHG